MIKYFTLVHPENVEALSRNRVIFKTQARPIRIWSFAFESLWSFIYSRLNFFMYLFAAVLYTAQGTMPVDESEKSDPKKGAVLEAKEERKTKGRHVELLEPERNG
jgi:hypothetical protein